MSALRDQLAQVAQNNATVALDRKRRQKLHSASLVYNPKTAATQDYEYIYEIALESFHSLVSVDARFKVFTNSLFGGSSLTIDRNVQTKDQTKDLDNAVNAYLMLVSSKWHLAPALHATEWLIRRFQIHIHNAEMLLLSTLNYYHSPVFKRILNIVKLPPLFNPFSNFVRNDKNPTDLTLIKLFNDMDFLKLYSNYLSKIIKQKVTYTKQLLFATCCFINVIAFNAKDDDKLNKLVPLILEVSAKLLASDSADCQMAAHTMLAVFATALPLNKNIIIAAIETILANLNTDEKKTKNSALVTVCKLIQTLKGPGNVDQLPLKIYKLIDGAFSFEYLLDFSSTQKQSSCDRFFTAYIRSVIRYDHNKLNKLVSILRKIKLEKYEVRFIITDLIHLSEIIEDKSQLIEMFEYFISANETLVLKCLQSLNLTSETFEIRLTTSLFSARDQSDHSAEDIIKTLQTSRPSSDDNSTPMPFKEFVTKNSEFIITKAVSMLIAEDERFVKLMSLFVEAVGKGYQPGLFLSSFFTTLESRITFVLRIIVSPGSPMALRLISLTQLSKLINGIEEQTDLFSLVPILTTSLVDVSKSVRSNAKKVLQQIAARPFTGKYFLLDILYGEGEKILMLSPKDSKSWLTKFLDEFIIESSDISSLLVPSKNEMVYLLFWCNQALHIPLPYPKTVILKLVTSLPHYSSSYSKTFEPLMSSYIEQRTYWEEKCLKNKSDLKEFESAICSTVAPKEKNVLALNFVIACLESQYEMLSTTMAARLLSLYPTLKFSSQLKIVQSIVDSSVDSDLSYDSVETLQNLPLTADIFVSVFKSNAISNDEQVDLTKRRRRSSAVNKSALQKEDISQIAEIHLKKITIVLETLDKQKVKGNESLLNALFNLLSDLETLDHDGGLPVLYAQETLSSCLLHSISSLKENAESLKLPSIRADILVTAIRASSSPQMQNKLLLIIGALASLSPETMLHAVMPIFTFMGTHTIRQDDEFSTLAVEKTIRTVVPALLSSEEVKDKRDETEFLLMSFTTAFSHVPKHRRVNLYATLVQELGPSTAISPFLFLIAQQYSNCLLKFKIAESKNYVEFFKEFLGKFEVLEQLHGFDDLFSIVELLKGDITKNKDTSIRTLFSNGVLNMNRAELFELKKDTVDFLNKVIGESKSDYYNTFSNLKLRILGTLLDPNVGTDLKNSVRREFSMILSKTLKLIDATEEEKLKKDATDNKNEDETTGSESEIDYNLFKDILFALLGNVLDLLPIDDFVTSIIPLLQDGTDEPIRHHLTLVTGRKFKEERIESFSVANEILGTFAEITSGKKLSNGLLQVTLNTIASIVSRFGDRLDSQLLIKCMDNSCHHLSSGQTELEVSSLAVLTTLIQILGIKTLAFYPKIVPKVIAIFKECQTSDNKLKEQLQLSIVLLFASMIKKIPTFLLSNLQDVFVILFNADEVSDSTRLSIVSLVVEHIPLRDVLKTMQKVWLSDVSVSNSSVAVSLFLSMLESTVEAIDKKSATQQSPVFFKLLLNLFEYRSMCSFDDNTISRIEASVHQIANMYVLKLNDKVFRPLFALIVNWAFDGEGVTNTKISREDRLIAFFKFYNKSQENLKSIITSYFTYLLEPTNNLLKDFTSKKIVNVNLRRLILISLTSSFKYDRDEYWRSTSRFELISESLINQLSNVEDVIGKYLVKAIGSLATNNAGVDEHNKIMSDLMISHMKTSCNTREKFWAVRSMKLIYSKVGDGWLVLLPRLVPIIAELLEDEDEEVEYEVRSGLVKVVENVLGEPFDRYLN